MRTHFKSSYANVVSTLALVVALGGTSYAAVELPKNSVGAKQIKVNAVTSAKVKDGSLNGGDFAKGQLPSGPAGPKGDTGSAGSALAWARVNSSGTLLDGSGLTFLGRPTGLKVYCFDRPGGAVRSIQLTVDAGSDVGSVDPQPIQLSGTTSAKRIGEVGCPAGTDFFVTADKADNSARTVDTAFYVAVIA